MKRFVVLSWWRTVEGSSNQRNEPPGTRNGQTKRLRRFGRDSFCVGLHGQSPQNAATETKTDEEVRIPPISVFGRF